MKNLLWSVEDMSKRNDGRAPEELRKIEAKTGIIKRADGSAMFRIGETIAYAAVYGPRELHPKFLQNPEKGLLRCNYNMMAFSGSGDRVRPSPNRRSREISMVIEKSLEPVLDLTLYPNAVIDIFIELIQTDAGTRCAGICAAAMALADAGIPMKDLVSALSVGYLRNEIMMDINGEEDMNEGATDIAIACLPATGEISLLQIDGEIKKDVLLKALEKAKEAAKKIAEVQRKALKERYHDKNDA
ncbi:MAG TPA: exosome complex exonuclease Rrp41 [Candidatus Nanoarchaeia archaeon]|nr:exosome complex exonuclease Rrp41 [Candidatus Nanoarchaeia archaeon]